HHCSSVLPICFCVPLYLFLCFVYFFFFFSSRRRHTRSKRDWSSDVCSSDLRTGPRGARGAEAAQDRHLESRAAHGRGAGRGRARSEERRVGKECRTRWWAYH